ncbi:hypothetical protein MCHIJ_05370 [Mycolicibacterium chitae]|uniref:Conserved protein of uncharacterized function, possibly exported n=1 Tax=Mycolicibacterium chitae TaxID=1792 RepID=A0A3S4VKU3_MYCCI|nr:hypothetical protein MCHIJ_05370 [Mycolicibacterium chitae]VEG49939.1 Conserved protein of uncharacterised function, possibly exported [Mycolicibacterium chitae]
MPRYASAGFEALIDVLEPPVDTLRAIAVVVVALFLASCGRGAEAAHTYGADTAALGTAQSVLGWNISVANLRFVADHVLVDVDAAVADPDGKHIEPKDIRFGLYGGLLHPIEATGLGSCQRVVGSDFTPLATPEPDRLSGTVCLGPIRDQSQVRGVYAYSPAERIPGTVVAYPAAYPVGLPPTNASDSGLELSSTSVEAWRADGQRLTPAALGDPTAFEGSGYMLLGLRAQAVGQRYRDDSEARGGPMMVLAAPSLPPPGLSPACSTYGASVLVLPDASYDSVQLEASLCTQGEINEALLYATVSVVGTHAAVWLDDERDRR